ncbi:TRAP-type C4-dicarboxylate transport system permease small subunit [Prauserella sediminis]|uniref:TRAP-type C4-dicarboxylate transport system permease small subunit n=1 Tax=Prauserella sediminis TaxID=577680 RepID=A0A839XXQ6_9PSEU|nr:TRAP transporter small permease [Prauserella sediminis]MBB3664555.1 TRAP-type C4-dicarboxylate transport system permease small subunit [Prauserella sediminis]
MNIAKNDVARVSGETSPTLVRVNGQPGTAIETTTGFRTHDHPRLDRVQNAVSGICAVLAGAALVAITVLTVAEVVVRNLFDSPLGWNVGLVEQYLMMAMAFFGLVTAYRTGSHIAVSTLYGRLPAMGQKALTLLGELVIVFGLAWLLVAGIDSAAFAFQTQEQPVPGSADLPWPTWWWKSIMPLAALLGLVIVGIDLYRELISPWNAPCTDYTPSDVPTEVDAAIAEGGHSR